MGDTRLMTFRPHERSPVKEMKAPNTGMKTPNTKHQRNSKLQILNGAAVPPYWSLEFGAPLEFGAWCLVFSSWCLVFGVLSEPLAWKFHGLDAHSH